jgi:hypothetical protein
MLIKTDVFVYQNKVIKCGKTSTYQSVSQLDSEQLWWWYCTVWEHVAKVRNRTLTAVMCSSGDDSIQYAVCYMATWLFTVLWAWLYSRCNTVDAADCCGMSGDERGRLCCSMSCHIVSVQVCTEGSVSSLPVTLCYQYMFLWPPAVGAVTEHRQQTKNDIIPLWILQFLYITCLPVCNSPLQVRFMHYKWF